MRNEVSGFDLLWSFKRTKVAEVHTILEESGSFKSWIVPSF